MTETEARSGRTPAGGGSPRGRSGAGADGIEARAAGLLRELLGSPRIRHIQNSLKYKDDGGGDGGGAGGGAQDEGDKARIFALMREINERAVGCDRLLSDADGRACFREALDAATARLGRELAGKRVSYVELGPEPVKTEVILAGLTEVADVRYTAIDINRNSEGAMREMLARHLPDEAVRYLIADYHDAGLRLDDDDADLRIITMLGFQEGNEFPQDIARMLDRLGRAKPTIVVSEHQVYEGGLSPIRDFYLSDEMVEFSDVVARMCSMPAKGRHEVHVLPMRMGSELTALAATVVDVSGEAEEPAYLITNVNLKPTPEQLQRFRSDYSTYDEFDRIAVGDGSVVFQLSRNYHGEAGGSAAR